MSVLISESFIHSFNRLIQTADSFRNESIGCPYERVTESIDSLDLFGETSWPSNVAYLNHIWQISFCFYRSMHLYIFESYFVCAVSLTHSLRLCKPHLAQHKYIISCRLH